MEKNGKSLYEVNVDERAPLITNHNVFASSSDSSNNLLLSSMPEVQVKGHVESLSNEAVPRCDEATPLIHHSEIDFAIPSNGFSYVNKLYEEVG